MIEQEARTLTMTELEEGLDAVRQSPRDDGILRLIVRRPRAREREVLEQGELTRAHGLAGDSWSTRGTHPHPDVQLTVMNARAIALIAQRTERWALAGDQLFVDLDLSEENLPPGARLAIGSAVIEVSAEPHTGCSQFVSRYGVDAMRFVNSQKGRALRLRGLNARVVQDGAIRIGDFARKVERT
jgi:MOSC domain-containing protein YiiM